MRYVAPLGVTAHVAELDDFGGLLDWPQLQAWVQSEPLPGTGPVTDAIALTGGSQNNLFLLHRDDASMVLRRPPRHLRPNSNATMLREARVVRALAGTDVPHARVHAVCEDVSVIGAAFYVMEPIDGFTPMGPLPDAYATNASWRREMAFQMVDAAARLGAIDPVAVGLADLSRTDDWTQRQVARWRDQLDSYAQFEGYGAPRLPGVGEVGQWLEENRPTRSRIGIIHGDLQWANVIFASDRPALLALIDWELTSLGDPLLDLGWILTAWIEPGDPDGRAPAVEPWTDFPTRAELVEHYCTICGRDPSETDWYFVLACYKLGIILEGTHARCMAGQGPLELGQQAHDIAVWLLVKAAQLVG
jgi:aminoglycoside phosphotransferase (APT) family kinase protein